MELRPVHRKLLKFSGIVFLSGLILFFLFRNPALHWAIGKVADKLKLRTGATLAIRDSRFSGFTTVSLNGICLVPSAGDTLLTAENVEARISVWTLFRATIRLKELVASDVNVNISCRINICNYESFLHHRDTTNETVSRRKAPAEKDYSLLFRRILDQVFNLTPQKASLENIALNYHNDTLSRTVTIKNFTSDVNSLKGFVEDNHTGNGWNISGVFSQTHRNFSVTVYSSVADNKLPLLEELTGAFISFDTLNIGLSGYGRSGQEETATGIFSVTGYTMHHHKIAEDTVRIPNASFNGTVHAGKNYLELDSASRASLAKITISPFLRYETGKGNTYSLKLKTDTIPATDFFRSLPRGMFDEVREIEADGSLQYRLDFSINSESPDDVIFESSMRKHKFRLRKTGSSGLMKMAGEFNHQVYERERLVRTFPVGESNPAYTTLDKISPNFINAVLTSEDGSFFYHNGFNEDAFRKSIAVNFKTGKFKRGGSTISMQLVKNVFLTRKKTIARKAEEAILVWLIESNRLYTKERMLEVYMNIIELGPGVYGIGEAAPFYFNKVPADLTLPEGIFLASLLPHPKWFKYSFDTLGNLKPYLADYYRVVSDFMLRKELISQQQHDELLPAVRLLGPAREMVLPTDTILKPEEEETE